VRNEAFGHALDRREAEDGPFTRSELAAATEALGFAGRRRQAHVNVVLDAGAFVAVEKRDRRVGAMLRVLRQRRVSAWTSAGS
jgi:hypothetical protein